MTSTQSLRTPWVVASAAAILLLIATVMAWSLHFLTSPADCLPFGGDRTLSVGVRAPSRDVRTAARAEEPFFVGLGDLPGGMFGSGAICVSADGSMVVGYSNSELGVEAFRWTHESGMIGLGFAAANGVSEDGSIVVGTTTSRSGSEAVRWTQRDGIVGLGKLSGLDLSEASGISADGSVIVGGGSSRFAQERSFRWTNSGGMVRLRLLPDRQNSAAYGVSADGAVIVGSTWSRAGSEAYRWTHASGMVGLGTLPGDATSEAYGVSADGSVVVGMSGSGEAFRWTKEVGMVGLGTLPGGSRYSAANGASADGSVVVGQSRSESGMRAFIWDATHGMRNVRNVLVNDFGLGTDLADWKLTSVTATCADSRVIAGLGINPHGDQEAWIAHIPPQ